jgi:cell fate regulator YaaT (PSP1 superfamily)
MVNARPGQVAGVRLGRAGRVGYYDAGSLELEAGDVVVVETEQGPRTGRVAISPTQMVHSDLTGTLPPVLRKATAEDSAGELT